jgi:hypothetical protein
LAKKHGYVAKEVRLLVWKIIKISTGFFPIPHLFRPSWRRWNGRSNTEPRACGHRWVRCPATNQSAKKRTLYQALYDSFSRKKTHNHMLMFRMKLCQK